MTDETILKSRGQMLLTKIKSYARSPIFVVLAIFALVFCVTVWQRACDRQAIESQTKEINRYEAETKATRERTEQLLQMFENQHASTLAILDAMKSISGTINNLVANDRAFEKQVDSLKNNYENSRNPNTSADKASVANRGRRRNLPIQRREDDVLRADSELYPGAGN